MLTKTGGYTRKKFVERDQSDLGCPVLFAKIFPFPIAPNQIYNPRHPVPQRGVSRSSRTLVRDAVDAAALGAQS
jgi:hypothetical protein